MDAFKTDMKRALSSWGFILGIAGMAIAAFFGVFDKMLPVFQGTVEDGIQQGFALQLTFDALSSDVVLLVLPILAALPFTTAFVDDYKSKYLRGYLPRAGKKPYIRAKTLATALSSGLTLFLGVMLVLVVFAVMFGPQEQPVEKPELTEYEQQMQMYGMMEEEPETDTSAQADFAMLMEKSFVFFLSGCLWSLVGAVLATITMSRYMAYASPFILYYVLVILSQRYLRDVYVINPQEWLNPQNPWVGGTWGVALLVSEITVIVALAYAALIKRRIADA